MDLNLFLMSTRWSTPLKRQKSLKKKKIKKSKEKNHHRQDTLFLISIINSMMGNVTIPGVKIDENC